MNSCPMCGTPNPATLKFCGECGTQLAMPGSTSDVRKVVTVLFADVSGSTALAERLDAESMRAVTTRYFDAIRRVIERHGGTVEKFIGDAVMAVFGIPLLHEDDALRAVRAAVGIRDVLEALDAEGAESGGVRLAFRTGINTGEVVAGSGGQTLVTGDTVNTAARLEQAAQPGEILVGESTFRMVRDAVDAEAADPIIAKGKASPVPAYRLVALRGLEAHVRQMDVPIVGRHEELLTLHAAFARCVDSRSCELLTVLAPAGVGKSRLIAEFRAQLGDGAKALAGRCLPYGEGITYWPVREVVLQAADVAEGEDHEIAVAQVRRLFGADADSDLLARRVTCAIGLANESTPQEEIFWATRKLLERLAREKPLVVLVEDIHWAEPTLLDLVEYILDLAADAPLLLLCSARPELLEARPGWGASKRHATTLHLEPLSPDITSELLDVLPGGSALPQLLRKRIAQAAEGNPLYVAEMLGMLMDEGHLVREDGTWSAPRRLDEVHVPESVMALVSARVDALPVDERAVAQRASVAGRLFEIGAVRDLVPPALRGEVGRALLSLVRKEVLRPARAEVSQGDAFDFRHHLIRDAAYHALPKRERAELHERFASWLRTAAGARVSEYEEILGYHLEQAHRYRGQLGENGEHMMRLAVAAAEQLASAGRAALRRSDQSSAADLLGRAAAMLPPGTPGLAGILLDRAAAQTETGDHTGAEQALDTAEREAIALEDRQSLATAHVRHARLDYFRGSLGDRIKTEALVAEAEEFGDDRTIAEALRHAADVLFMRGELGQASKQYRRAIAFAQRAGAADLEDTLIGTLLAAFWIATPVAEQERLALEAPPGRGARVAAEIAAGLAVARAHQGEFEEARTLLRGSLDVLDDIGLVWLSGGVSQLWFQIEMAADDPAAAERELRRGYEQLAAVDERMFRPTNAALLSHALSEQGKVAEAKELAEESAKGELLGFDEALWRSAKAMVLSAAGRPEEARPLLVEALQFIYRGEWPQFQAVLERNLARVLAQVGEPADARAALGRSRSIHARLGNRVWTARVDRELKELRRQAAGARR